MIVACQVMDPGSIPGERMFLLFLLFLLVQKQNKKNLFETSPQLPDPKSDALSIAPLRHFVEFAIKVFFIVSPLAHVAVSESGHH